MSYSCRSPFTISCRTVPSLSCSTLHTCTASAGSSSCRISSYILPWRTISLFAIQEASDQLQEVSLHDTHEIIPYDVLTGKNTTCVVHHDAYRNLSSELWIETTSVKQYHQPSSDRNMARPSTVAHTTGIQLDALLGNIGGTINYFKNSGTYDSAFHREVLESITFMKIHAFDFDQINPNEYIGRVFTVMTRRDYMEFRTTSAAPFGNYND